MALKFTAEFENPNRIDYPLAQYADESYPLLHAATRDMQSATGTKVEWLVDTPDGLERWENFTQIVRTPFSGGDREMWRALERHLRDIENTLWDGIPRTASFSSTCGPFQPAFCGGARHYLGRNPLSSDKFYLCTLQDCVLLKFRGEHDQFLDDPRNAKHEFLTEFSLQVVPTPRIRRH